MTLTATKPKLQSNRFKALVFGLPGVGKSHFAYSFPGPYIIDTEGLMRYSHFTKMINDNGGVVAELNTIEKIMDEIRALRSEKHEYKTLVIDSLSPVYRDYCNREAKRLEDDAQNRNKPVTDSTDFGRNARRPNRMLEEMAQLISKIDMNVILISHAKAKFVKGENIGETADTPDKFGYMLGAVIQIEMHGELRKGRILKSRYNELESMGWIDPTYAEIKKRFGAEMFERAVELTAAPSPELLADIKQFEAKGLLTEELKTKWLSVAQVPELKDMSAKQLGKCLEFLKKKFPATNGCVVYPSPPNGEKLL